MGRKLLIGLLVLLIFVTTILSFIYIIKKGDSIKEEDSFSPSVVEVELEKEGKTTKLRLSSDYKAVVLNYNDSYIFDHYIKAIEHDVVSVVITKEPIEKNKIIGPGNKTIGALDFFEDKENNTLNIIIFIPPDKIDDKFYVNKTSSLLFLHGITGFYTPPFLYAENSKSPLELLDELENTGSKHPIEVM